MAYLLLKVLITLVKVFPERPFVENWDVVAATDIGVLEFELGKG